MGTLLTFRPRPEDAAAKTEAILQKIGELYQQKVKAREALPGVLAQLAQAGEEEAALRYLVLWGAGEAEPHEILAEAEKYAAVAGIHLIGDRDF